MFEALQGEGPEHSCLCGPLPLSGLYPYSPILSKYVELQNDTSMWEETMVGSGQEKFLCSPLRVKLLRNVSKAERGTLFPF